MVGEWEEMEHKGVGEQLTFRRVRRFGTRRLLAHVKVYKVRQEEPTCDASCKISLFS